MSPEKHLPLMQYDFKNKIDIIKEELPMCPNLAAKLVSGMVSKPRIFLYSSDPRLIVSAALIHEMIRIVLSGTGSPAISL